ncbi:hypothetical protein Dda3937_03568 [Dickeya dadantii 3937]|uniref:Uncharacterized protein n=1 Tax=Dickeya dadantii (strain 3937) TaxID=198628 RepID=E0SB96_DICD3|nr:hypothetical protein Dda3937_03568 [Dickeya dadantii 3937]
MFSDMASERRYPVQPGSACLPPDSGFMRPYLNRMHNSTTARQKNVFFLASLRKQEVNKQANQPFTKRGST